MPEGTALQDVRGHLDRTDAQIVRLEQAMKTLQDLTPESPEQLLDLDVAIAAVAAQLDVTRQDHRLYSAIEGTLAAHSTRNEVDHG